MKNFKYALYHGKFVILILIIAVYFVTSFIFDAVSQINSAKHGLEMILIDVSLSIGNADELARSAKKATKIKYTGAQTIDSDDTREYIKTVSDYTFTDYLNDIAEAKNSEIIFVTKELLPEVYQMKRIVPLNMEGSFDDACYYNGILYAFPLKNAYVTEYGASVISLQEETFAILLQGDHTDDAREFLKTLPMEEK